MMAMAAISMNSNASTFKKLFGEAPGKTSLNKTAKAELNIIDNSKAYIKIIDPSDGAMARCAANGKNSTAHSINIPRSRLVRLETSFKTFLPMFILQGSKWYSMINCI